MRRTILVSACLLGENCRYDGRTKRNQRIIEIAKGYNVIPVCPEILGGLSTPREACEISEKNGMAVVEGNAQLLQVNSGRDITYNLLKGAERVLEIIGDERIEFAIFKERSPSCGVNQVVRNGKIIDGMGVTTAVLRREGITIYSEESIGDEASFQ
ncbi:MAG: DUF523 domain-containing protein [candidate division Zixibacteria bacterium]|nr:DUF523 domain-containing protein [candidate division Zixibacteria bacterium]